MSTRFQWAALQQKLRVLRKPWPTLSAGRSSCNLGASMPTCPQPSLKDECGLGSEGAGVVIARRAMQLSAHSKKLIPSRLSFVGQPVFDPSPFLDERSREVFRSPMDCSKRPSLLSRCNSFCAGPWLQKSEDQTFRVIGQQPKTEPSHRG